MQPPVDAHGEKSPVMPGASPGPDGAPEPLANIAG